MIRIATPEAFSDVMKRVLAFSLTPIDVLITTNPRLFTTCQKNPILSTKQLFFIEKEDMLPEIIQKIYQNGALSCS